MIKKEKFSRRDFFKITAAALDKTELSLEDHRILEQYARKTAYGLFKGRKYMPSKNTNRQSHAVCR